MNHPTTPAIKAAPTIPPTTPPAIAPEFRVELLCEVEVGNGLDPDGLKVDWETLDVDVGTMEAVPVTSGESRQDKYSCVYRKRVSYLLWLAHPRGSSCHRSISWCDFLGKQAKGRGKVPTDVSMYAHLGTRVPAGTGEGKLGWKVEHMSE